MLFAVLLSVCASAVTVLPATVLHRIDALMRHVLGADTRSTLMRAASSHSLRDAYAELRAGASRGGSGFSLDLCLILAMLIVAVNVAVGAVYCAYVVLVALPRQVRMDRAIRSGTADYQQKRQQTKKNGDGTAAPSVADDTALLSRVMATYTQSRNVDAATTTAAAAASTTTTTTTTSTAKSTAHAATPSADASAARSRRTATKAVCTAVLRGCGAADVHLLLASPSQKYALVSTRGKRKAALLYAQADVASLLRRPPPPPPSHAATPPLSLLAAVQEAMTTHAVRDATAAEVYSAAFSSDDARLVVGERSSDVFFVFALGGGGRAGAGAGAAEPAAVAVTTLRAFRLPARRLVSSLPPHLHVLGDGVDALVCLHDKACEVEVLPCGGGGGGGGGVAVVPDATRHKFRVGHALAWAQHNALVAVAGSFLRQPRLGTLVWRGGDGGGGYQLETTYTFSNTASRCVRAMALVQRGTPAFNTRSYLVVFTDDGTGCVYNLDSLTTRNTAEVVCHFVDADYADNDDGGGGGGKAASPLCLLTAVQGTAYMERLTVALVCGGDATVLRQSATAADGTFALQRVVDLRDVHDGAPVKTAALLCGGDVLATCATQDGRGVRLFAVPALA